MSEKTSLAAVLVTQGNHRFYTLTFDSELLAKCCTVSRRDEDPKLGFQRHLDAKRAESIAKFIDNGGVIPGSIILSAQEVADFEYSRRTKTVSFTPKQGSFLILDGQHRVFGFTKAKTNLRVPVVVFNNLSLRDEVRMFIDINTLQKAVPNELLLDIKQLAETESDLEEATRAIFDEYASSTEYFLYGKLSPTKKTKGKITRQTFHRALKPIIQRFSDTSAERLAEIFDAYLRGAAEVTPQGVSFRELIHRPIFFQAISALFPTVAKTVAIQYAKDYTIANFEDALRPLNQLRPSAFTAHGTSYLKFAGVLKKALEDREIQL